MNRWLIAQVGLFLLTLGGTLGAYWIYGDQLPEKIPTHWNIHGVADGFTTPQGVLTFWMIIPAMMLIMLSLSVVLPRISPQQYRVERFDSTWFFVMMVVGLMMALIQIASILPAFVPDFPAPRLILAAIGLGFVLMGNVLGKVRRNFWMGIRTPWTLASEVVWNRTHRLGGWLFVLMGLVAMFCGGLNLSLWIFFASVIVTVMTVLLYSLIIYKQLEGRGQLQIDPPLR